MERVPNFIKQQICFFEDETTALRTDFFFFKFQMGITHLPITCIMLMELKRHFIIILVFVTKGKY